MDQLKQQLRIGSWVLVAALFLASVWFIQSISRMDRMAGLDQTITVSGTGSVFSSPDIAIADLAVSVEDTTAKKAQDQASKKSSAVVDYLKGAGVDEKDIRTSGYQIYPQYDYLNGRSTIRGYQVTQSLEVKIRDLEKANNILDGVVGAGINQVGNVRFYVDEPEKLQAEAREKAIADAKKKADELKDQLGVRLGRIVTFSENINGGVYPMMYAKDSGMGGGASTGALPAGQNEIVANVTITYQIR